MNDTPSELKYSIFLTLNKEKKFFGPGICMLLQNVKETKSINKAAKRMNMTNTKAIRIIKEAEEELGYKILVKNIGGAGGGGSTITKEGEIFLNKYLEFRKEVEEATNKIFEKHYK